MMALILLKSSCFLLSPVLKPRVCLGRAFLSLSNKEGVYSFCLEKSYEVAANTKVLRFQLPQEMPMLTLPVPSGVKVLREIVDKHGNITVKEKSYSPISLPDQIGSFDLLVKSYLPSPEIGFGNFLCNLQKGESVSMKLKPPRKIHGDENIKNRWDHIGFISGGTGVAPFIQIIRTLLSDSSDKTQLSLLNFNRNEKDILLRNELEQLASSSNGRFTLVNSLTNLDCSDDWSGALGRGNVGFLHDCFSSLCPKESASKQRNSNIMIMVCGRDDFVDTWAGKTIRVVEDGKKWKEQGPLLGILADAGFDASQVYKF